MPRTDLQATARIDPGGHHSVDCRGNVSSRETASQRQGTVLRQFCGTFPIGLYAPATPPTSFQQNRAIKLAFVSPNRNFGEELFVVMKHWQKPAMVENRLIDIVVGLALNNIGSKALNNAIHLSRTRMTQYSNAAYALREVLTKRMRLRESHPAGRVRKDQAHRINTNGRDSPHSIYICNTADFYAYAHSFLVSRRPALIMFVTS